MNQSNELDEILLNFTNKIVNINNYQHFIKDSTKRSFEHYFEQMKIAKDKNIDFGDFVSGYSVTYHDAEDGKLSLLGGKNNSFEDLLEIVRSHNNKQYQWLLVEAYEAFEGYLSELYAFIGYKEHSFWVAKDFGNISIDELDDKDLQWFRKCVKNKRDKPESIYKQFRCKMPVIDFVENNNPQETDYKFLITLISKLRHIIVHNGGIIEDKDGFVELVFKDIGMSLRGNNADDYKNDIFFYIGEYESENFVLLLEHKQNKDNPFSLETYHDRLKVLISVLASYAILLKNFSQRYLSEETNLKKITTDIEAYKKFFSSSESYKHLKESEK